MSSNENPEQGPVIVEGYMRKAGNGVFFSSGQYRNRYFVLQNNQLTYYATEYRNQKGKVCTDDLKSIEVNYGKKKEDKNEFVLIFNARKNIRIRAYSKEQRSAWIQALHQANPQCELPADITKVIDQNLTNDYIDPEMRFLQLIEYINKELGVNNALEDEYSIYYMFDSKYLIKVQYDTEAKDIVFLGFVSHIHCEDDYVKVNDLLCQCVEYNLYVNEEGAVCLFKRINIGFFGQSVIYSALENFVNGMQFMEKFFSKK